MSYSANNRIRAGIKSLTDTTSITQATVGNTAVFTLPEDATHLICYAITSQHQVRFGDSTVEFTGNDAGFRISTTSSKMHILPIPPDATHWRVRAIAASTANRFVYAFANFAPGTPIAY